MLYAAMDLIYSEQEIIILSPEQDRSASSSILNLILIFEFRVGAGKLLVCMSQLDVLL